MRDSTIVVGGPYFDDLSVGDRFTSAPGVTLTDGLAATHLAIVGGRMRLAVDGDLSRRVIGRGAPLASPALVWDVAIGQSTLVTGRAIANLFYRGLVFRRFPAIGDTLRTQTEITGLRAAAAKPGRPPRGLAVMRIVTTDQNGDVVLDFHRCAMLPARAALASGTPGEMEPPPPDLTAAHLAPAFAGWDLAAFTADRGAARELAAGTEFRMAAGDVVSSAPELARMTLNLAAVHHDSAAASDGRRLVYGGHTIGIAAGQVSRALPELVTILGWQSCDHTGPVHEGDTLTTTVRVEHREACGNGSLVTLRALVRARDGEGTESDVLDWRLIGLIA